MREQPGRSRARLTTIPGRMDPVKAGSVTPVRATRSPPRGPVALHEGALGQVREDLRSPGHSEDDGDVVRAVAGRDRTTDEWTPPLIARCGQAPQSRFPSLLSHPPITVSGDTCTTGRHRASTVGDRPDAPSG